MLCEVHKSRKKEDTYLYFRKPADLTLIPDELGSVLGELEFVMELELNSSKRLASEDVLTVMENIEQQGFHLQMPPKLESLLVKHKKNR